MRARPDRDDREPERSIDVAGWRVELLPRAGYEARYTPEFAVLGFAFDQQEGLHAFSSDRLRRFEARANGFAYLPAGCSVYSRSEEGGEYLRVLCRRDALVRTDEERFSNIPGHRMALSAHRLRREVLLGDRGDPLTIETLVLELAGAARSILGAPACGDRAARWMTPNRLKRIEAMIEEGFAQALTVQELADALGLSADFLTRAYRVAAGRTPRDAIIDRRIRYARDLLQCSSDTLASIAVACGFSSHAHMTAQFTQRLGISPSALRLEN